MINKKHAEEYAIQKILEFQKDCPVELEINWKLTEDFLQGYVFYYNSKKFWKSGNIIDSLAGNGPIFVYKSNGKIQILPSNQSVEKSIKVLID